MRKVGRYALLTRLSSGEHGDIFLARVDSSSSHGPRVGALVSLELVRGDIAGQGEFEIALLRDARQLVRIHHSSLVRYFEIDRRGTDLYVVSELLEGPTFADVLLRRSSEPMPAELVLFVLAEIANGLGALHDAQPAPGQVGPSHGALCPSDVRVLAAGGAKVIDWAFGSARATISRPVSRLPYASPEQVELRSVDRRTDLYSLGVIAAEAISGERLFRRPSVADTKAAIREGIEGLGALLSSAPESVATLVTSMLSLDLSKRPASAREVERGFRAACGLGDQEGVLAIARYVSSTFSEAQKTHQRVIDAALRRVEADPDIDVDSDTDDVTIDGLSSIEVPDIADQTLDTSTTDSDVKVPRRVTEPIAPPKANALEAALQDSMSAETTHPRGIAERPTYPPELAEEDAKGKDPLLAALEDSGSSAPTPIPTELPPSAKKHKGVARAEVQIGQRIARYELVAEIASGAISTVYRAVDPNIGRNVALKVMDAGKKDGTGLSKARRVALFEREARLCGLVPARGFPIVLDAGRDNSLYFMAFELIEGEPLHSVLLREARPPESLVSCVIGDVVAALERLHRVGVLHGDIRPSNIIVSERGSVASLVDLSMGIGPGDDDHPLRSKNLPFLAPECLAENERYTDASEQFCLGIVMYTMLCGRPPFTGGTDDALRAAIRGHEPRPPEAVQPGADARLSEITMRMLEKNPARRYRDFGEIARAIDEVEHLRPPEITERIRRASRNGFDDDSAALALSLSDLLDRVGTLGPLDAPAARATDTARAIARSVGLDPRAEMIASLCVATQHLLDRCGLERTSDLVTGFSLASVIQVLDDSDRILEGVSPDPRDVLLTEVVAVIRAYDRVTTPDDSGRRRSPRKAIGELRKLVDEKKLSHQVVEALVEHLREIISALDVPPRKPPTPRILIAVPGRGHNWLDFEARGFEIDRAVDLESAWDKLTTYKYDGVVATADLQSGQGYALLKKIRRSQGLLSLPVVMLSSSESGTFDEHLELDQITELVASNAALDTIADVLQRLFAF